MIARAAGWQRGQWAVLTAACAACAVTGLFRFLALTGFPNDQFQHLAGAQQMLMGEWPTKDFFDPGMPLMYVASAGAQLALGRTLFAEAVLVSLAYGLATAFTLTASWRVSGSLIVAVVAAGLCIAIFPRSYGYPKGLLYAAAPLLLWAWMRVPSLTRLAGLAGLVAAAFLFRHDHGVYLGAFALAGIVLTPAGHRSQIVRRAVTFALLVSLFIAPYLVYVEMHEGLARYVSTGLEYSSREADRTRLRQASLAVGYEARLWLLFHALPLAAVCWAAVDARRGRPAGAAILIPLVLLAVLVNIGFLRDPLATRLPDVIVPAVLIGAWLAGRALRVPHRARRAGAVAVVAMVALVGADSVVAVGRVREHWGRTGLSAGLSHLPGLIGIKTTELTSRFSPRQVPDNRVLPLVPFFRYLDRCTTSRHRLLVVGYAPEVFFYARRAFGGGQSNFIEGYYDSEDEQRRIVERLHGQDVPFVLELTDVNRASFPQLYAFIDARFAPMAEIAVAPDRTVRVLVDTGHAPTRHDAASGWPCYL